MVHLHLDFPRWSSNRFLEMGPSQFWGNACPYPPSAASWEPCPLEPRVPRDSCTRDHVSGSVLRNNNQSSPVDDKVRPEVAHDPGHLPVVVPEVEDPGGEEVEELVAVGDAARDGRLRAREQEVPQRVRAVILKRVEVVLRTRQGVKLHELVGRGFYEESSDKLRIKEYYG